MKVEWMKEEEIYRQEKGYMHWITASGTERLLS
jgi:hypothetical protein